MKRTATLLASVCFALSTAALSADPAARIVLRGYDPVAYFTDGGPVQGNPNIGYDWDDGRYYFASEQHREMFAAEPDRYAPQFGGYCTGSMSRGVRGMEAHPQAWVIVDNKLYVFGAPDSSSAAKVRQRAQTDSRFLAERIPKAEKVWRERGR